MLMFPISLGYAEDIELAQKTRGVHLILGSAFYKFNASVFEMLTLELF